MSAPLILTKADCVGLARLDADLVEAIAGAFRALAGGAVAMPPILRLDIPGAGEMDVKTAFVPGLPGFALKASLGFFANPTRGLPSLTGLMALFDARTGRLRAMLLDDGYLTDIRTAAAGAVAARALSRKEARVAAILGAGAQARLQLEALTLVRPMREARIWARDGAKARACAQEMTAQLGLPVSAVADPARAVAGADIVVTTTPSATPILMADWLAPGQHVTAMGSDAEHKGEIDPGLFARVRYVADSRAQTARLGELRAALNAGVVAPDFACAELGEVVSGTAVGRASDDDITLCDLTGTGAQDTAIANLVAERAVARGVGLALDLDAPTGRLA